MCAVQKFYKPLLRKMSQKICYPACERNKSYILQVLQKHMNATEGTVLEISSGTGQHISYFAAHFPHFTFQPSEYDTSLFNSIREYARDTPTNNVEDPIEIDVTTSYEMWNLPRRYNYVININMMHIAPFKCSEGLFKNVAKVLQPEGLLITYGPYAHNGVITPQSNINFDQNLRYQNPEWGLRDINDLKAMGLANGIKLLLIYDLPANNKCLVWQNINKQ